MVERATVMKFGGTSVEDGRAIANVAGIVKRALYSHPVVIVSAISGFTIALLRSVQTAIAGAGRAASKSLDSEFERHLSIAHELLTADRRAAFVSTLGDARSKIRQLHKIIAAHPVTSPPLQDEIIAYGEHLSSQLVAAVLRENGVAAQHVDARGCIKTDDNYGSAAPHAETAEATSAEL